MPSESTTRPILLSAGIGQGHIKRRGVWVEGKVSSALVEQPCGLCQSVITAGALLSKAGPGQSACTECRPIHHDHQGGDDCWLCKKPEKPTPSFMMAQSAAAPLEPNILVDDTDLSAVARFFGVDKRAVFNALAPLIFDDRIDRYLLWKILLIGCEARHGGLAAIEKRLEDAHLRRNRRRSVPSAVITAVRLRDRGLCRYCGTRLHHNSRTFDHVIPVALAGTSDTDNVVQCCRTCNAKKADNIPSSAAMYLLPPGTTRMTIPPAKERRTQAGLPTDEDWPGLVMGTLIYTEITARDEARRQRFGSAIRKDET